MKHDVHIYLGTPFTYDHASRVETFEERTANMNGWGKASSEIHFCGLMKLSDTYISFLFL